jgi:hypothetical protein
MTKTRTRSAGAHTLLLARREALKIGVCMTYIPKPLDTTNITLPDELVQLTERLAESTHDVWAAQRMSQGWVYGSERNDAAKTHPCLVPYADLPDSEKDYDRKTAMETLKAIMSLGYRIVGEQ